MDLNAPKTKTLPEAETADDLEEEIPWDQLSEGSRQYLEDIRAGIEDCKAGRVYDADESLARIRAELEADAEQS